MLDLPAAFAGLASMMSTAFGGPYFDAVVLSQETAGALGDDGAYVPGSDPDERPCQVQIDALDERMRPDGWTDKDVRFIILAATIVGPVDTDAQIQVTSGQFAGLWSVSSLELDTAGIGWVGKGRRG